MKAFGTTFLSLVVLILSSGFNPPPRETAPTQEELDEISERGMELVEYEAAVVAATDAIAKTEVKSCAHRSTGCPHRRWQMGRLVRQAFPQEERLLGGV